MLVLIGDTLPFGSMGSSSMSEEAMGAYMEYLGFIPEEWTYGSALQRTYLERVSVHACTQMYTREYTMVYTRVYLPLLGSRYMLGVYTPRIQIFLS